MKKMLKNIHRGKWSLVLIPVIMISLISLALFGYRKIFASMTYKLITDSNGIRWQYGFDPSNNTLEVSFFDTSNSITQITIPDKTYFINNDAAISSVSKYIFTSYADHDLGTPSTFSSTLTKIDLSKANEVNGVAPLLKTDTVTEVVFNTTASKIGKDAFREAKLNAKNMNKITSVGPGAFYNVTFSTTTISMPNLTSLGAGSFEGSNITTVELNSPIVGVSAFKNCTSLTTATFKDNVNELSPGAFMGDTALSSVTFNKVKIIGSEAFKNCTSFNQDLKDTQIESIGAEAFAGTTGYNLSIKLPNGVETLPYKAFFGSNIESIDINNVYWIGPQVFENCHLTEIDLDGVERIDYRAFANNSIEEIYLPKSIVWLMDAEMFYKNPTRKVTIAFDTLSTKMFELRMLFGRLGTWTYEKWECPVEEVELIAPYANGERAVLPNSHFDVRREYSIKSGNSTYSSPYCYSVSTSRGYPSNDTLFNEEKQQADKYRNVLAPNFLYEMLYLENVTVGEGYEFLGCRSISNYNSSHYYTWWYDSKNYTLSEYALKQTSLKNIVLPETLKGIGVNTFYASIIQPGAKINLPESLEWIGHNAFNACMAVDGDFDFPNLKYVGVNAFQGTAIQNAIFHDKLEYIGQGCIWNCIHLKKLILDCDYFSLIRDCATQYNLEQNRDARYNNISGTIYRHYDYKDNPEYGGPLTQMDLIKFTEKVVTKPLACSNSYDNTLFYNIRCKVIDLEDLNWTTMQGNDFIFVRADTVKLPKNLTKINAQMFHSAVITNPLEIPESVVTIEDKAFVTSEVTIEKFPSNLKTIGAGAFFDSIINDNIVIPSSVTSIGKSAFAACNSDGTICTNWRNDNKPVIQRNSITFKRKLTPTNTQQDPIEGLLFRSVINEIILEEEVTETPTITMNGSDPAASAQYSEFSANEYSVTYSNGNSYYYDNRLKVNKVTIKGLSVLPAKAFINNPYIKIVDLSEDANLTEIQGYAFYNAVNLEKVILPTGKEITIGEHAFHGSGLESIGDETSALDVKNTDIILDGECTFQAMPDLTNINLTEHFNEGVIPNGTFADNVSLIQVELQNGVTRIEPYAFYHDSVIDSFVMYGDTEIKDADYYEFRNISSLTINLDEELEAEDFTITINDSVKGKTTLTKSNFSNNQTTYSVGDNSAVVKVSCSDNISFYKINNTLTIYDRNKIPTIPAESNIYCYSTNELCQNHYDTYKTEHDNEDTKLYYLDEVIYMDSNGAPVVLNEDQTDINTDDLVLYALRRDGVVLVSKKWKQKTGATKLTDSGITIRDYNSNTDNPSLMIFNNTAAIDDIDTDTNDNFENIEYVIGDVDPETGRTEIAFRYDNLVTDTETDTTLRTQGNAADVTYSDGCGGAAFANVIFRDVAIGSETPSFGENPTREGYDFLGWDKEVSETVAGDVIYTARWNRVGDPIPEPPEPVNPWSNIVNPQTGILLIILLPIIVLVVGTINIYLKKKREA